MTEKLNLNFYIQIVSELIFCLESFLLQIAHEQFKKKHLLQKTVYLIYLKTDSINLANITCLIYLKKNSTNSVLTKYSRTSIVHLPMYELPLV